MPFHYYLRSFLGCFLVLMLLWYIYIFFEYICILISKFCNIPLGACIVPDKKLEWTHEWYLEYCIMCLQTRNSSTAILFQKLEIGYRYKSISLMNCRENISLFHFKAKENRHNIYFYKMRILLDRCSLIFDDELQKCGIVSLIYPILEKVCRIFFVLNSSVYTSLFYKQISL